MAFTVRVFGLSSTGEAWGSLLGIAVRQLMTAQAGVPMRCENWVLRSPCIMMRSCCYSMGRYV